MILLTIGTTEPFDRLVKAMDNIAAEIQHIPVVAQISSSAYSAKHMQTIGFLSPLEYNKIFDKASLIISHAGMGTIISATLKQKAIIVMPRRANLRESNSDHQYATATKLAALNYVKVANNQEELASLIRLTLAENKTPPLKIGPYASNQLICSIKEYINSL